MPFQFNAKLLTSLTL